MIDLDFKKLKLSRISAGKTIKRSRLIGTVAHLPQPNGAEPKLCLRVTDLLPLKGHRHR
jgi:hypothetical protein